ncbi:hypothetical protein JTE90_021354 [Oedothorax gibbosus]|uniref:Integrase catalytic domain-containing protein n=1 Tax=Oedothorax gibbosus TaxID=931172 RepID=A0AAV6TWA0_9ARAC|nr:hypothetical protein JTE90_021354 [Oedothorax gibbosus]
MKTTHKFRERFYWEKLKLDVDKWCRTCITCTAKNCLNIRTRGRLKRYNVGAPFERIAIDVLGLLPQTKQPEAYVIPNQEATTVAEALLQDWICQFGVSLLLHSDQGTNFTSAVFTGLMNLLGVNKTRTTPLHPQSNGMVKRQNRTILDYLSLFTHRNQNDWD